MARRRAVFITNTPKPDQSYYWQEAAACANSPEVDKAQLTGYPSREVARDLKQRYCNHCPVIAQCLTWAQNDYAFSGIAGGKLFTGERATGHKRRILDIPTGA